MPDPPSSPAQGFSTLQEELAYYKAQYAQLEVELHEFQASSRELEAELERDVDASEKRERRLKERVEALGYEVDEWKAKHKQSKTEANAAQNALQKEITSLRDANRTLQLKLRDIEVANDDYERQARNTTSSLEDMESKYNVTLERGVMLEEEMRAGEQEREALRIEAQRLRDELSDLKIEAELTQGKLRRAEDANRRRGQRKSDSTDPKSLGPRSPASEKSVASSMSTPPASKSEASASENQTSPSSALSEKSANVTANGHARTPSVKAPQVHATNTTPRPGHYTLGRSQHGRAPSILPNGGNTPSFMRPTASRPPRPSGVNREPLPRSESLYQIRGLIGKMQKLEERVQSARSKLPAPTNTPPNASPRGSTLNQTIPASVTVRSNKKRPSGVTPAASTPSRSTDDGSKTLNRRSRLSYGMSTPGDSSRPSSRASNASHSSAPPPQFARPSSRASISGLRSMADSYAQGSAAASRRPRSSMAGDYGARHADTSMMEEAEGDEGSAVATPTATGRRTTLDRSGIPAPAGSFHGRRQSGSVSTLGYATVGASPSKRASVLPLRGGQGGAGDGMGETF